MALALLTAASALATRLTPQPYQPTLGGPRTAANLFCNAAAAPSELLEAPWLSKVIEVCPFAEGKSGEARMGQVLEWLSTMLVTLELSETSDVALEEDDELDEDFVNAARPWLHTKAFFDVSVDGGVAESLWEHMIGADYLQPNGEGGSLILLLPTSMPKALFDEVVATVAETASLRINKELKVCGCHPEAGTAPSRSPVPLIQLFNDQPDLLVEGGSASDMAGFL